MYVEARRFELRDPSSNSNKFWEVSTSDNLLIRRWGRIGTEGQTKTEKHQEMSDAEATAQALIRSKMREGYIEVTKILKEAGRVIKVISGKAWLLPKKDEKPDGPVENMDRSLDVSERSIDL